jgi:hypothetical protein
MTEVVKLEAGQEAGPAASLLRLIAEADEAGIAKATLGMIEETAAWIEDGLRYAVAGETVRVWWLHQVREGWDGEDADEFGDRWDEAFAKARKAGIGAKLDAAIAAKGAEAEQAKAEPEAEAKPGRIMLPAVVPTPKPPARIEYDEAIAAMNECHAVIENVGGKTVIASWEPSSIDLEQTGIVYQTKESFLLRYSNRTVLVDVPDAHGGTRKEPRPLGHWWLSHRNRRQYRGVTFVPAGPPAVHDCLNLWQGWGVEARAGDWSLIRQHIEEVIAGDHAEFTEYVVRWIAWSIQNPDAPAEVALVLIGEKGAGKGTLVRCLERIFGAHAFQVTSREHVIDKFNGHLQDCVLLIADEAYWGGDKRCVGRLQGMITEPTLSIERKGLDVVQVRNFLHVVMLAEPGWVIPAGRFERRYAAFAVSSDRRGDRDYFRALHRQIGDGGAGAMFYDLHRMDLEGWHPREMPEALLQGSALQQQQGHTLSPWEQWYVMLLHNGKLPSALAKRPNTAFTNSLLANVRERVPRLRWDASEVALRDFLVGLGCTKYRASYANGWAFPPLAECRADWERKYGPQKWDSDVEEWCGG